MNFIINYFHLLPIELKIIIVDYIGNIIIRNNKYIFISNIKPSDYRYNIIKEIKTSWCNSDRISVIIGKNSKLFTISYYFNTNIFTISKINQRNRSIVSYSNSSTYRYNENGELEKISEWYNTLFF
jgi:hypothetical protein